MEKKPIPEQCVAGIREAIENFCKTMKCTSTKDLSDTQAVLMIFFRKGNKARIHLIGTVSVENIALACAHAVQEANMTSEGAMPSYAA